MNAVTEDIRGSGGGAKGGQGVVANNTLRSASFARLVELLGEGQIQGLVNGGCSIYFNQTPVVNLDGTVNFRGVQWESRVGLPDQTGLPGNATAEQITSVNVQAKFNITPTVVTIIDPAATSARVAVSIPSLASVDGNGNTNATNVSWAVDVQPTGGAWTQVALVNLVNQKCESPYSQQSVFALPSGGCPWNLRVRRLTADSTTINLQNETWFESYTSIVAGDFIYPNSAVVGLTIDSELFSANTIPTRTFHIKGLIIQVPTNYNPTTRAYTGIWDGTFQMQYCANPAWVLYDLLTNDRYGIGGYIDATMIDKWSLYQIAQYCDQLVPDGFGGSEPRYVYNGVIANRQEAFKTIQSIAGCFRGMAYWSVGQVFTTADMPADPIKLVAPADVIDGHFNYSGTALKTRHSVAMVRWNDPVAFYLPAVEVVVNDAQLAQFGWREVSYTAAGCTSRGQAHRMGKWILDTERYSTETVEYTASWDHIDVRPGDIISIADPAKAQVRIGGRILNKVSAGVYTLDSAFLPTTGQTYSLLAELPDGSIVTKAITSFAGAVVNLVSDFATTPLNGAMWVITGTDVAPTEYRVISITETEKNLFKVTALFYDPTKYARVENDVNLAPIQYHQVKTTIDPPQNFQAKETIAFKNGVAYNDLTLSWTPSGDFLATGYHITGLSPVGGGMIDFGVATTHNFDIASPALGPWTFNIQSIGASGIVSTNVSITFTVQGWNVTPPPTVTLLEVFGGGTNTSFSGQDCHITWQNNFYGSTFDAGQEPIAIGAGAGQKSPFYSCNVITITDANSGKTLRTETVYTSDYIYTFAKNTADNAQYGIGPQRTFKITVVVLDTLGRTSAGVSIVPNNPVPALVIPTVTAGTQALYVNYVSPSDPDFVGAFIWCSTNLSFDPMVTVPVYQGPSNFVAIPGTSGTYYYIRMACYDQFGTGGLNVSPPVAIEVGGYILDTSPPAIPTTLTLTPTVITLPTGTVQSILTANWDVSPSANFAYFDVQIKQTTGGAYISYQTALDSYSWADLTPNISFTVQVRAWSKSGFASVYCSPVAITMPAKTTAPGAPSALSAAASLKSSFLTWTNPSDPDIDHIEIWGGTSSVLGSAALIGTSYGTAFTQAGLTTGTTYYYWVRAISTSQLASAYSAVASVVPGAVGNGDISAGTITGDRIVAGTITGSLLNISTSIPATITLGATGVTIGAAANPAALINSLSTLVAPGLIQLSGATTLSSWQAGGDLTKIAGGSIYANTIAANSLTIGLRGIAFTGLQFSFAGTTLSWATGTLTYMNDAGVLTTITIAAGSTTFSSGTLYAYWVKDATVLSTASAFPTASNTINFATYNVAAGLIANYGQTSVDGSNIVTGTVTANQIAANTIQASNISAGTITATQIAAGTITGDRLVAGTITATQIAAGTITGNRISAGTITASNLSVSTLSAITANVGAITAGTLTSSDGLTLIDLTNGVISISDTA